MMSLPLLFVSLFVTVNCYAIYSSENYSTPPSIKVVINGDEIYSSSSGNANLHVYTINNVIQIKSSFGDLQLTKPVPPMVITNENGKLNSRPLSDEDLRAIDEEKRLQQERMQAFNQQMQRFQSDLNQRMLQMGNQIRNSMNSMFSFK